MTTIKLLARNVMEPCALLIVPGIDDDIMGDDIMNDDIMDIGM